jgi:hypothetical protein
MGNDGMVSRSFDIWSLGCVYLEFVTWFLGGPELGHEFTQLRKTGTHVSAKYDRFFDILNGRAYVKPEVENVSPPITIL